MRKVCKMSAWSGKDRIWVREKSGNSVSDRMTILDRVSNRFQSFSSLDSSAESKMDLIQFLGAYGKELRYLII